MKTAQATIIPTSIPGPSSSPFPFALLLEAFVIDVGAKEGICVGNPPKVGEREGEFATDVGIRVGDLDGEDDEIEVGVSVGDLVGACVGEGAMLVRMP
jgi:hypothetical protein